VSAGDIHPLKLVSLLLQYPDGALLAARPELCDASGELPPGAQTDAICRFVAWYRDVPAEELQGRYVETFDFARRSALYLSYHTFGDRRQRGMALLNLKQRYAAAGFEVADSELPDYLPLMLEFAVLAPEPGLEMLERHREPIELIRSSLHAEQSPWAALFDAVTLPLPGLTRAQAARIRRLAQEGPPEEEVGLEPFAPPETMPVAHAVGP
jgi:nitrate reductase molybdenum cofactor assembly chaperone NarJ/NarW